MANKSDTPHDSLAKTIKLRRYTANPTPLIKNAVPAQQNHVRHQIKPARKLPQGVRNAPVVAAPPPVSRPADRTLRRAHGMVNNNKKVIRTSPKPAEIKVKGAPGINTQIISEFKENNKGTGKVLVIVGNGPSAAMTPLDKLLNKDTIDIMSINKPDHRLWPTKYWLFCDNSQYRRHIDLIGSYSGITINATSVTKSRERTVRIKCLSGKGFSDNMLTGFYIGRSSVYAALQVGVWLGYDKIYVFGIDMCAVNGKLYPWGSNPDVDDGVRLKRFAQEAEHYDWAGSHLNVADRSKIFFCSRHNPWSFIEKFNRLDEQKAVDIILENIKTGDNNG